MLRPFTFYAADDNTTPQGGASPEPAPDPVPPRQGRVETLIGKYNGDPRALAYLVEERERENAEYRRRLAAAENRLPEGAIVLTKDEATAWQQYQQLGKADDLHTALTEREQLQQRLAALEREQTLTKAAVASGYKASVLRKLPDLPAVVIKDVTADGRTEQQPFVTTEQGEQPLTAYVEAQYAEFLPALRAETQGASGIPYPAQRPPAHGAAQQSAGERHIKNTKYALPKGA